MDLPQSDAERIWVVKARKGKGKGGFGKDLRGEGRWERRKGALF